MLRAPTIQVNSPDVDGWLPLHVAAYYGAAQASAMLLRHQALVSRARAPGGGCGGSGGGLWDAAVFRQLRGPRPLRSRASPYTPPPLLR